MSKSRSSEEKEREKVRDRDKGKDQENDDAGQESNGEEDTNRQRQITQYQLNSESESEFKSATGLMLQNEATIPSSPPPSYEHVLEQTRLEQEAHKQESEPIEDQQQTQWLEKNGAPPSTEKTPAKGPEILHKSSKEFYRAMAKQWGITCKMSDHCRCLDCQSHYFDCEYEKNEHQKTDGGLGAGTPMFISEVMQGSGCTLL